MVRSFRYKAKMNATAVRNAEWQLVRCAELYNAALEERREAWRLQRKSINYFDQTKQITLIKRDRPEYATIGSGVLENCLKRLDLAFRAFYRRVKHGEKAGYPRFKSSRRYDSLTFRRGSGWRLDGRHLAMQGIGTVKLFLSRPVEGTIKTVTLKRDGCGDWWVVFVCEGVPAKPLPATGEKVGIDLGLSHYAALSDGKLIENPRPLRAAEHGVRHAQRRVAKKARGGANRRKAVRCLARRSRHVQNVRRDFHWKLARAIVQQFDFIAVEDLNVKGLAGTMFAKSVHDAAWSDFLHALATKAEDAARDLVRVDPRGTSQACSECGCVVRKTLSDRVHSCRECGCVLDRDVNAARNILTLAQVGPAASRPGSKTAAMTREPEHRMPSSPTDAR